MKQKILKLSIILSCCLTLQSCLLLGLGAASGVGAYFVGKKAQSRGDERLRTEALIKVREEMEAKQKQVASQDTGITNSINQKIVSGAISSQMAIYPEVKNGIVILHGRVPDSATAQRVIASTKQTRGVSQIISNLVIVNKAGQTVGQAKQTRQAYQQPRQYNGQVAPINPNSQNANMANQISNSINQQFMRQNTMGGMMQQQQMPQSQQYYAPQQQMQRTTPQQYYGNQQAVQPQQGNYNLIQQQTSPTPLPQKNDNIIELIPKKQPNINYNQTQNSQPTSNSRRPINNRAQIQQNYNDPPPTNYGGNRIMSEAEMAQYENDNDNSYIPLKANLPRPNSGLTRRPVQPTQNTGFAVSPSQNFNPASNQFYGGNFGGETQYQDLDSGYIPLNSYNPVLAPNPGYVQGIDTIEQPNFSIPDPAQDNDSTYEIYYY